MLYSKRSSVSLLLAPAILSLAMLAGCSTSSLKTSSTINGGDIPSQGKGINPVSPAAQSEFTRALDALRNGKSEEAEEKFLLMTKKYPDLSGPYTNLGILYFQSGKLDKATDALKQAISLNDRQAAAHNYMGIIYRNNGNFAGALQAYQSALESKPDYAYAHLNIGILHDLYLLEPEKALSHYQAYQELISSRDKQVDLWIKDLQRRTQSK